MPGGTGDDRDRRVKAREQKKQGTRKTKRGAEPKGAQPGGSTNDSGTIQGGPLTLCVFITKSSSDCHDCFLSFPLEMVNSGADLHLDQSVPPSVLKSGQPRLTMSNRGCSSNSCTKKDEDRLPGAPVRALLVPWRGKRATKSEQASDLLSRSQSASSMCSGCCTRWTYSELTYPAIT